MSKMANEMTDEKIVRDAISDARLVENVHGMYYVYSASNEKLGFGGNLSRAYSENSGEAWRSARTHPSVQAHIRSLSASEPSSKSTNCNTDYHMDCTMRGCQCECHNPTPTVPTPLASQPAPGEVDAKQKLQIHVPDAEEWMTSIRGLLFALGMKEEMTNWGGSLDGWGAAFEWIKYHVKRSQAIPPVAPEMEGEVKPMPTAYSCEWNERIYAAYEADPIFERLESAISRLEREKEELITGAESIAKGFVQFAAERSISDDPSTGMWCAQWACYDELMKFVNSFRAALTASAKEGSK